MTNMTDRIIQCTTRLTVEENELVKKYAEKMHVSVASFLRYTLFNAIGDMEKEKEGFIYE